MGCLGAAVRGDQVCVAHAAIFPGLPEENG